MKYRFTTIIILIFCFAFSQFALAQVSDPVMLFYRNGEEFRTQADKARAEKKIEIANEKYYEAVRAYDHAIAISDTSAQIFYKKGLCLYLMDNINASIGALEASIERDEKYMDAYELMLKIYSRTENTTMTVVVLDRMSDAVDNVPKKLQYHLQILQILLSRRDYREAMVHVQDALIFAPSNLDILYHKAQIHNGLAQYQETIDTINPLLKNLQGNINQNARFYYELGYAYHHLGNYEKAKDIFARGNYGKYRNLISKLQPDHFYNVAYGYTMIFEYETAIDMLHQALKIEPAFAKAYDLLAEIAIKTEHHHKGIEYYEKAVLGLADQDEYLMDIYANKLMPTLINAKQFGEAVLIADQALNVFPTNKDIKYLKALALHHQNKNQDAIAIMNSIMNEASSSSSEQYRNYFAIGMMYIAVNDAEKAKEVLVKASKGPYSNASQHSYDILVEQEARQRSN